MWDSLIDVLASFGIANWIMAALTIVTAAFAWRQTHRLREDKRLIYSIGGAQLYESRDIPLTSKIALRVGNASLDIGYYYVLLVQNCGTRAVERSDLANDGIIITTASQHGENSGRIETIELASADQAVENFELSIRGDKIVVDFDYISPGSGFAVHGISTVPPHQLVVKGKLKSFGDIHRKGIFNSESLIVPALFGSIIIGAPMLIASLYYSRILLEEYDIDNIAIELPVFMISFIGPLFIVFLLVGIILNAVQAILIRKAGAAKTYFLEGLEKNLISKY